MNAETLAKMAQIKAAALAKNEAKRNYNKEQFKAAVDNPAAAPVAPAPVVAPDPNDLVKGIADKLFPAVFNAPEPEPEPELESNNDIDLSGLLGDLGMTVSDAPFYTRPVLPPSAYAVERVNFDRGNKINTVPVPVVAPVRSGASGGVSAAVAVAPAPVAPAGKFTIAEYSNWSIVLRGDTKPIKEKLTELGGVFNKYLRGGEGWVFPKRKILPVREFLGI